MTSGSSVTTPNPIMICAANPKYPSAVMIGSKTACWNPNNTRSARGSTHR